MSIPASTWALASPCLAAGDRLTPDEVQHEGVSARPYNDSGLYIGAGVQVGQANTTEPGASPGLAVFGHIEPGFQMNRGEFGRLEFSGDLFAGSVTYRLPDSDAKAVGKVTQEVPAGLLLKAGYGYSLGSNMYGVLKAGVGPVLTKFKIAGDNASASSDTLSGLAWQLGWEGVIAATSALDVTFGLSWTQISADVGKLNPGDYSYDQSAIVNMPAIDAGIRLRL